MLETSESINPVTNVTPSNKKLSNNLLNQNVPQTSSSKIIITLNEQSYTFDKKSYKPEFLSDIINKIEWDNIITEASKIMGQSWSKKRMNDQIKLPRWIVVLAILCVLLTIIYTITLYLSTSYEGDASFLLAISVVSIVVGLALSIALAIYNFTRKLGKFYTLDEIMQEDIDKFLAVINLNFEGKLEFIYQPQTKWIECNILVKSKNLPSNNLEEKNRFISNNNDVIVESDKENEEENGGGKLGAGKHSRVLSLSQNRKGNNQISQKHSRVQSLSINNNEKKNNLNNIY